MILRNLVVRHRGLISQQQRHASILSALKTSPVLVSTNKDIFTNLALEHWLYTNLRFGNEDNLKDVPKERVFQRPVVLIWTDEPCLVLGRHQNPWVEATMGFVERSGLKLARRHSGGGCVYHDENNICISIIGERKLFEKRQENLKFVAKVLDERYGIKCEPTKRHDLIDSQSGFKISGTAAKLGRFNCYHHFTLLIDTDKEVLSTAIRQNQQDFIKTNSSLSTRSKVVNLKELDNNINVDQVVSDLASSYTELYKFETNADHKKVIRGDETDLVSLNTIKDELQSWSWVYGMTPRFSLEKCLTLTEKGVEKSVKFNVQVNKGLFEKIDIESDLSCPIPTKSFEQLIGTKFNYREAMVNVAKLLDVDEKNTQSGPTMMEQVFLTFLLQMIHKANF